MTETEDDGASRPVALTVLRSERLRPWLIRATWVLGAIIAFAAYLRLSRTRPVNSDGASNALQAWDMLHGNLLLHGWSLTDVPFYTTELPQYMLVELVRGLHQDVVHVAAAMTYTLAVLLAAFLAKGKSTGREALVRAGVAAGIMLAPQLSSGVNILISSPDHIGTSVPIMMTCLILDRARPRWYIPVIVAALLGWAEVADTLVLYIGVLPLALVCAVRVYREMTIEERPLASQWYHLALGGGALVAAAAASLALHLIHAAGGFFSPAPSTHFASGGTMLPHSLGLTAEGLLLLGGADFFGLKLSASAAFVLLHLVGVFLIAWGIWLAARRFLRNLALVDQVLLAGIVINLATYVLSTHANFVSSTREIDAVLPLSAALAGRLLARRLMAAKLVPLLIIVALGYLLGLAHEITRPPAPAQNQQLASWLAARQLHSGLSGYWESNVVTLTTGDKVRIRAVTAPGGRLTRGVLESDSVWFNPDRSTANFVVIYPGSPQYPGFTSTNAVLARFGQPARTYHVGRYLVLVWNHNLLRELR